MVRGGGSAGHGDGGRSSAIDGEEKAASSLDARAGERDGEGEEGSELVMVSAPGRAPRPVGVKVIWAVQEEPGLRVGVEQGMVTA